MHRVSLNYHQRWSDIFYPFENYMTDLSISPIPIKTKQRLTRAFVEGAQVLPIESSFETAKVFASIFAISVSCGNSKNLAPLVVAWARASYSLPKSRFSRLNVGKEMTQVILICLQPRKSFQTSFV